MATRGTYTSDHVSDNYLHSRMHCVCSRVCFDSVRNRRAKDSTHENRAQKSGLLWCFVFGFTMDHHKLMSVVRMRASTVLVGKANQLSRSGAPVEHSFYYLYRLGRQCQCLKVSVTLVGKRDAVSVVMHSTRLLLSTPGATSWLPCAPHPSEGLRATPHNGPFERCKWTCHKQGPQ